MLHDLRSRLPHDRADVLAILFGVFNHCGFPDHLTCDIGRRRIVLGADNSINRAKLICRRTTGSPSRTWRSLKSVGEPTSDWNVGKSALMWCSAAAASAFSRPRL